METFDIIYYPDNDIAVFQCPYCSQIFDNNADLVEHLLQCSKRIEKIYPKQKLPKLKKQLTFNDFNQRKLI